MLEKFEHAPLFSAPYRMPPKNNPPADKSASRLSGKAASDALKKGNNAGMLFKKEVKAATNVREHVQALVRLRIAEKGANGDCLRQ